MSLASLGSIAVVTGRLTVPFAGPWHADLVLATPVDTAGPQTLLFAGQTWSCAYVRDIVFAGRRGVRLVGGSGGWRTVIPAQQYGQGTIATATVLADAAAAAGELPPVVDASVPATVGQGFCRARGRAALVLQQVVGDVWWIDTNGIVQTAPRSGSVTSPFQALEVDGAGGIYEIGTDSPNDWMPGATFSGPTVSGTVNRVMHAIEEATLRTEVMVA